MLKFNPGGRSFAQNRAALRRSIRAAGPKTLDAFSAFDINSIDGAVTAANVVQPDAVITQDGEEILLSDIA